ncbi:MAG: hypothetical protein ABIO04_10155 [Ferruginibacter sp.]
MLLQFRAPVTTFTSDDKRFSFELFDAFFIDDFSPKTRQLKTIPVALPIK